MPALVSGSKNIHSVKIECPISSDILPCKDAVAGGMSCGIDSFYMAARHINSKYINHNLTHLTIFNIGAFSNSSQFEWQKNMAERVAEKLGLPLVTVSSNLHVVFPEDHLYSSTYRCLSVVYAVQKLFGTYYMSSDGEGLLDFSLVNSEKRACAYYDILTCSCFSTSSLQIVSDGCAYKRFDKTKAIIDFQPLQEFLHVCTADRGENCGTCGKCKRTLLTLDALECMENFTKVFDIPYYQKNKKSYYAYLFSQRFLGNLRDPMLDEVYDILKKKINMKSKLFGIYLAFRARLASNPRIKAFWHFLHRR